MQVSSIGLLLSVGTSVSNVFTDVSRKMVLDRGHDAAVVSFWGKVFALATYAVVMTALWVEGTPPELPVPADAFGRLGIEVPPSVTFLIYLAINAVLEGTAIVLNLRALQLSPLSYCAPFMALTPLFLLPAGRFLLKESIAPGMVVGVCLVVIGSLVVNRQLFAKGFLEPAKAIVRERGSRYMVGVALLLTVTNTVDKWFVSAGGADLEMAARVSRSLTVSAGKSVLLAVFFVGLAVYRLRASRANADQGGASRPQPWTAPLHGTAGWMVLAGALEAVVLVLQLTAMQFTVTALVISIKRAGIVLAVFMGWLIFKERGITDRVIAAGVMLAGVVIFFITQPGAGGRAVAGLPAALGIAATTLVAMSVALYLSRGAGQEPA